MPPSFQGYFDRYGALECCKLQAGACLCLVVSIKGEGGLHSEALWGWSLAAPLYQSHNQKWRQAQSCNSFSATTSSKPVVKHADTDPFFDSRKRVHEAGRGTFAPRWETARHCTSQSRQSLQSTKSFLTLFVSRLSCIVSLLSSVCFCTLSCGERHDETPSRGQQDRVDRIWQVPSRDTRHVDIVAT